MQQQETAYLHQLCIPLKSRDKPVAFPPNFKKALAEEYATRYLERLGATATPQNLAAVARFAPIDQSTVTAAWKSRGSLSDVVNIDPFPERSKPSKRLREERTVRGVVPSPRERRATLQARPIAYGTDQVMRYVYKNVEQTFADMKKRHLYPFNRLAQASTVAGLSTQLHASLAQRRRKWNPLRVHSVHQRLLQQRTKADPSSLCLPPTVTLEEVRAMQLEFLRVIPYDMIHRGETSEQKRDEIHELFVSDSILKLIGFTVHYIYWTFLRDLGLALNPVDPSATEVLTSEELQQLYSQIMSLFMQMKRKLGNLSKGQTMWLPLGLMSLRVTIETAFRTCYPDWYVRWKLYNDNLID